MFAGWMSGVMSLFGIMSMKMMLGVLMIALTLTLVFGYIYSERQPHQIYDVDIHITLYKDYFEIDSCRVREEDCGRKVRLLYEAKAKNPDAFRHDYRHGMSAVLDRHIVKGKDIRIRFTDVAHDEASRLRMKELGKLANRTDARIYLPGMKREI